MDIINAVDKLEEINKDIKKAEILYHKYNIKELSQLIVELIIEKFEVEDYINRQANMNINTRTFNKDAYYCYAASLGDAILKIGCSSDPIKRVKSFRGFKLIAYGKGGYTIENMFKQLFSNYKYSYEYVYLNNSDGYTEMFDYSITYPILERYALENDWIFIMDED